MKIQHSLFIMLCPVLIPVLVACQAHSIDTTATIPPTPLAPLRVLVLSPERYTYGDSTPVDELIEGAGAINAADHLTGNQQIDDGQLLDINPDVILFTRAWQPTDMVRWQSATIYADLRAIQSGRLYQFNYPLTDAVLQVKNRQYVILLKRLLRTDN